jgi:peptidoglycan/LPS O-acetylase OafA/YrhL
MQPLTKPHYPILDGLRGTAAILVVIFHLLEAYFPVFAKHPMHHGYLAVDFFIIPIACGMLIFFILLAWVALKFYDEPVRAWLKRKYLHN